MNTPSARLMWKEARTHRALWLSILAGESIIHLTARMSSAMSMELIPFLFVVTSLYVLCAVAVQFAGEVHDRTDVLARMLPCSTFQLTTAKLCAVIIGSALLVMAALSSFLAIEFLVLPLIRIVFPRMVSASNSVFASTLLTDSILEDAIRYGSMLSVLLAFGVLVSTKSREVFSSIMATLFVAVPSLVTLNVATYLIWNRWSSLGYVVSAVNAVLVVLLAIPALHSIRTWHRIGARPAVPVSERRSWFGLGSFRIERFLRSTFLASWLESNAKRQPSAARLSFAVAWKELQSIRNFFIVSACLVSAAVALIGNNTMTTLSTMTNGEFPTAAESILQATLYGIVAFLFMECGQRTVRTEQIHGTLRFLSCLGLSPERIWFTKSLCWFFTGAFILAISGLLNPDGLRTLQGSHFVSTPLLLAAVWSFAAGQLAACWIRRQLIAFVVATFLTIDGFLLMKTLTGWQWSISLTLIPYAICAWFVAGISARHWVDSRMNRSIAMRNAACLLVPLLGFTLAGWLQWRYEPRILMYSMLNDLRVKAVLRHLPQGSLFQSETELPNPEDSHCWNQLNERLERIRDHFHSGQETPLSAFLDATTNRTPEDYTSFLEPFNDLLDLDAFGWPLLPRSFCAPWSRMYHLVVIRALIEDSKNAEKQQEYSRAADRLILACRLSQWMAQQTSSWDRWSVCLVAEQNSLLQLQILVNTHPARFDLPALAARLKHTTMGPLALPATDPSQMLSNRTQFAILYQQAVQDPVSFQRFQSEFANSGFHGPAEITSLYERSTEMGMGGLGRNVDILRYSETVTTLGYPAAASQDTIAGFHDFLGEHLGALARYNQQPTLWDTHRDTTGDNLYRSGVSIRNDTIAMERATTLVILLQQHRKVHGTLPQSLLELEGLSRNDLRLLLSDPYTAGGSFGYLVRGVRTQIRVDEDSSTGHLTAEQQPLLFTSASISRLDQTESRQQTSQNFNVDIPKDFVVFLTRPNQQVFSYNSLPYFIPNDEQ